MALLLYVSLASAVGCGNYCGAYMCGGSTHFHTCNYTVEAVDDDPQHPACLDACCREHDYCCEAGLRPGGTQRGCNARVLECFQKCDPDAHTCWYGAIPLPTAVYTSVFQVTEDWCCNAPCWMKE